MRVDLQGSAASEERRCQVVGSPTGGHQPQCPPGRGNASAKAGVNACLGSSAYVAPGSCIENALEAACPQLAARHRAARTGCTADDDPAAGVQLCEALVEFVQRDVYAAFGVPAGELAGAADVDDLGAFAPEFGDSTPCPEDRKEPPCEVRNDKTQEQLIYGHVSAVTWLIFMDPPASA